MVVGFTFLKGNEGENIWRKGELRRQNWKSGGKGKKLWSACIVREKNKFTKKLSPFIVFGINAALLLTCIVVTFYVAPFLFVGI